jgi:hypothetical protein
VFNIMEMEDAAPRFGDPSKLLDNLRSSQALEAELLLQRLSVLVDALSSGSTLTASISNLRLQRFVLAATIASLVAAATAIAIAVVSAH